MLIALIFLLAYLSYFKADFLEKPYAINPGGLGKKQYINYDDQIEYKRVTVLFETGAIYCEAGLTLGDLSLKLNLPSKYLSYLINTYTNSNFNDFVNSYRVKAIISKIRDPREKHKSLLGIALETGFSSKTTFNQVFKKHTGQVPSHYLA